MRLSVVIPVVDEERRIGDALAALRATPGIAEIMVVDGGSRDRTIAFAEAAGATVLRAPRGRGPQMNAGARAASGNVLLFLHADATLPADAAELVGAALGDEAVVGGAFRIRTVADGARTWVSRLLPLADVRSHVTRLPYGDQALFVRRDAFFRAGGFPDEPLMEDVVLARRLRRLGRLVTVPAVVRVSGRRFVAHPVRATVYVWTFPLLHRLGVTPRVLARWYGDPR